MPDSSAGNPVELVEFLLARLDERQAWAQAASAPPEHFGPGGPDSPADGVHWRWGMGENWEQCELNPAFGDAADGEPVTLMTVETWRSRAIPRWQLPSVALKSEEVPAAVAGHIALNDPAYVLQDIAAKRRIIEFHVPQSSGGDFPYCAWCQSWDNDGNQMSYDAGDWPCEHLKLLARPYADHADYRQEWGH